MRRTRDVRMGVAAAMAMLMLLGCSAAPPGPPTSGPADGDNWTPSAELELKIEFLDADSLPADAASAGALEAELVRRQILNALQAPEMSRPLRDEDSPTLSRSPTPLRPPSSTWPNDLGSCFAFSNILERLTLTER